MDVTYPSPEPMPDRPAWSQTLRAVSEQPLALRPDFPDIAARHEAWWRREMLDRPILIHHENTDPTRPINRRTHLLHTPDRWLDEKLADVRQLRCHGDALPHVRVDFGPVLMGGLLGGEVQFDEHTSWTHRFIDESWSNFSAPDIDRTGELWQRFVQLLNMVGEAAPGHFLVCTPDLGGSADTLMNLRGATELCMDVIEQPENIDAAVRAVFPHWHRVMTEEYEIVVSQHRAGLIHWTLMWSDEPYMIPSCDFNFMISPDDFNRLFLPDIARRVASVGRGMFHLDGPGATAHIDALLTVPEIRAIQYVPGEGTPSVMPHVPMFRKIQQAGRALQLVIRGEEVLPILDEIEPEGVAMWISLCDDPAELVEAVCRRFDCSVPQNSERLSR